MNAALASLSDKEKQTLRLLVSGYDAKSMARHLGLSVHTVNERLRDARRKLGTSSSREAARMLREAEAAATPELLGDEEIGDAPDRVLPPQDLQPAEGRRTPRRAGWIVGGFAMTATLALLALSALSGPAQAPATPLAAAAAVSPTPASETAAIDAARQFLALTDRDDWAASWQAAHQSFKLLNTKAWWTEVSQKLRGEVGTVTSRELATVDFAPAPPSGYWTVTFKAHYTKKGDATETLQVASENGTWKVHSIVID